MHGRPVLRTAHAEKRIAHLVLNSVPGIVLFGGTCQQGKSQRQKQRTPSLHNVGAPRGKDLSARSVAHRPASQVECVTG